MNIGLKNIMRRLRFTGSTARPPQGARPFTMTVERAERVKAAQKKRRDQAASR